MPRKIIIELNEKGQPTWKIKKQEILLPQSTNRRIWKRSEKTRAKKNFMFSFSALRFCVKSKNVKWLFRFAIRIKKKKYIMEVKLEFSLITLNRLQLVAP